MTNRNSLPPQKHARSAEPTRVVDEPSPGHYLIRLCRGGPWVPARIAQDADGWWRASIEGAWCSPAWHPDPLYADGVMRIANYGRAISEAEYAAAMEQKRLPARTKVDPRRLEVGF